MVLDILVTDLYLKNYVKTKKKKNYIRTEHCLREDEKHR